jgi:hypothetical protein
VIRKRNTIEDVAVDSMAGTIRLNDTIRCEKLRRPLEWTEFLRQTI